MSFGAGDSSFRAGLFILMCYDKILIWTNNKANNKSNGKIVSLPSRCGRRPVIVYDYQQAKAHAVNVYDFQGNAHFCAFSHIVFAHFFFFAFCAFSAFFFNMLQLCFAVSLDCCLLKLITASRYH